MRSTSVAFRTVVCLALASCGERSSDHTQSAGCLFVEPLVVLGELSDSISIASSSVDVARFDNRGWVGIDRHDLDDVLLYGSDGAFQGRLLPKGQGPSEVASPQRLSIDESDSLWISDGNRRLVIVDHSGHVARVVFPFTGHVHGFTEAGGPSEVLVKGVERDTAVGYARFWTRTGDSIAAIGPGADPAWTGRSVHASSKNSWAPSTSRVWSGLHGKPDLYLEEWTPAGTRPLVTVADVWAHLSASSTPERTWSVGVAPVSADAFIGLARIGASSEPTEHLGVLYLANAAGDVQAALLLDDAPAAFVDSEHYYAITESAEGLRQIGITRIRSTCSP